VSGPAREPRQPRRGGFLAATALLAAIAALGLAGYLVARRAAMDVQNELAALKARVESLGAENRKLESANLALAGKAAALAGDLAALRGAVEVLQGGRERDSIDYTLAEIEYLLVIATQRLTLARDARTALAALEAADRRLAGNDQPGMVDLRAQLASDMNALRAVPDVDVAGLSLFLADLVQRAESLPLRDEYLKRREAAAGQPAVPETARGWRGLWLGIWREISRHMIVTRDSEGARVTLLPEERYFLAHNLRLQLETARLAVLRGDSASLKASLGIAAGWIERYYDTGNAAVANVLESLRRMATLRLDPELPDVSSSLESTRALMHERAGAESGGATP
jgi:uroporphyrin-3 C-methyltransferase